MPTGRDRRLALFRTFSSNYSAWTGLRGRLACPICLVEGDRNDVVEGRFDLGHIVPRGLRQRGSCVLLCRDCNGRNGRSFDELLTQHVQLGLRAGERLGKVKLGRSTARVAVSGGSRPERLRFVADDRPSRRVLESWRKAKPFRVPVSISVGKDPARRLDVARLSIAYLTLVKYYLYAPVFMPAMDRVREQIKRPDERILPDTFVSEVPPGAWGIYEDYGPLALPSEPRSLRCLIVRALDRTVMLPLSAPGDVVYERLQYLVDFAPSPGNGVQVEYGSITIPNVQELLSSRLAGERFQLIRTEDDVAEAIIGGKEALARAAAVGRLGGSEDQRPS